MAARKRPAAKRATPVTAAATREILVNGHGLSDEEIEKSLSTGANAGILEDYFGPAHYQELRRLTQESQSRNVRGGDRVLILPGIMGSRLGVGRLLLPDIIWFDPIDVAQGRLAELALDGGNSRIKAVGVILFSYLSLKLRLRIAGFDADFAPFDWRRPIRTLGGELASRIKREGKPVYLVCHSMGGLVARASLEHKPDVRRIVMLGTPNFGSLAPLQAIRGAHRLLKWVEQIDRRHDMAALAAIFSRFPGLLELIAAPGVLGTTDWFDLTHWPKPGQLPTAQALRAARNAQAALPAGDPKKIVIIAGTGQDTAVDAGLDPERTEFVYTVSKEGDGTVPLRCALLPGARTYYVEAEHGFLPNNLKIQHALPTILATGETRELPDQPPQTRQSAVREVPESLIAPPVDPAQKGHLPSVREQRYMLAEFAAPDERAELIPRAAAAPGAMAAAPADQPATPFDKLSDMVVIGRGRGRRLEITLAKGSIADADAQCYVVGLFKTVAPGGAAAALDAAMGGAISDLVARRMFGANVGEVSILPNGSYPMRAKSVAFVGLGAFDSFKPETLEVVGENLIRTFAAGRVDDFAVVPFGAGSSIETRKTMRHLLCGFLRGLKDADKDHRFRGVTVCETNPDLFEQIRVELHALAQTELFDDVEVTFRRRDLPERLERPGRLGRPEASRIYLIVRETAESEADPSEKPPLVASVLTTGDKAAIHSNTQPSEGAELDRHLRELDDISDMSQADLDKFGTRLAELVLADNVRQALARYADRHLVVVHDAGASRIPWETVRIGDGYPALKGGISHRYEAANLSVAKWLESRQRSDRLKILLIVDPTEDLAGARKEGERIQEMTDKLGSAVECTVLKGEAARKIELLRCFGSGEYDVVHYAGHAFFDPNQRARSGLLCAGREVLSGTDLAGVGNLPSLMFFNACEAARVRGQTAGEDAEAPPHSETVVRSVGFAESLLRGGISNFLGTYWEVGDDSAKAFAENFYKLLLEGRSLDEALQSGRKAVRELGSPDWADYVFYGDPEFLIKLTETGR